MLPIGACGNELVWRHVVVTANNDLPPLAETVDPSPNIGLYGQVGLGRAFAANEITGGKDPGPMPRRLQHRGHRP